MEMALTNSAKARMEGPFAAHLRCSADIVNSEDLLSRAKRGSTVAQSVLGISCLVGEGMPRDTPAAFRWLSAAASKGASRAQMWLGTMYEQGLTVPVDVGRARELYEAAASRGEFFGCIFLARLFASGKCGSVPRAEAEHWCRRAPSMNVQPYPELDEARDFLA